MPKTKRDKRFNELIGRENAANVIDKLMEHLTAELKKAGIVHKSMNNRADLPLLLSEYRSLARQQARQIQIERREQAQQKSRAATLAPNRELGKIEDHDTPVIEDDAARLLDKAQRLNMPAHLHDALQMMIGTNALESVYDAALTQTKALSGSNHADLIHQKAERLGLPEAVINALSLRLGNGFDGLIEQLSNMAFWGTQAKAYTPPAAQAPLHPFWKTRVWPEITGKDNRPMDPFWKLPTKGNQK